MEDVGDRIREPRIERDVLEACLDDPRLRAFDCTV
jgi:hypothetical protein